MENKLVLYSSRKRIEEIVDRHIALADPRIAPIYYHRKAWMIEEGHTEEDAEHEGRRFAYAEHAKHLFRGKAGKDDEPTPTTHWENLEHTRIYDDYLYLLQTEGWLPIEEEQGQETTEQ